MIEMRENHPGSPCVRICNFNPFTGLCDGCLRTLEEIGGWTRFSPEKKHAVLAELARRRAEIEERARGGVARGDQNS